VSAQEVGRDGRDTGSGGSNLAGAERFSARHATVGVDFPVGQDKEKALADRLQSPAPGTVQFAGRQVLELFGTVHGERHPGLEKPLAALDI
jgi:hypothetical protein